uniref:Uncharacterized protein n=1 Tax=Meloidogyne floridensis TaxID=298350 RepID=A0A915PAS2_9BILA
MSKFGLISSASTDSSSLLPPLSSLHSGGIEFLNYLRPSLSSSSIPPLSSLDTDLSFKGQKMKNILRMEASSTNTNTRSSTGLDSIFMAYSSPLQSPDKSNHKFRPPPLRNNRNKYKKTFDKQQPYQYKKNYQNFGKQHQNNIKTTSTQNKTTSKQHQQQFSSSV